MPAKPPSLYGTYSRLPSPSQESVLQWQHHPKNSDDSRVRYAYAEGRVDGIIHSIGIAALIAAAVAAGWFVRWMAEG